ncbi:hypothetical protein JCM1393_28240 [Clostridium carnis]
MVEREYDYIRGNTVIQPKRKNDDTNKKKRLEEEKKQRLEKNKRIRKAKIIATKNIIQVAALISCLGVLIIGRYGKIYKMQQNLTMIKDEIRVVKAEGEALRFDLLKYSSLENVKTTAANLGMKSPDKNISVTVDNSKNYFSNLSNEVEKTEVKKNIITKIKDAFN